MTKLNTENVHDQAKYIAKIHRQNNLHVPRHQKELTNPKKIKRILVQSLKQKPDKGL